MEDLDIFLELKYQNTEGQEKLNTTHKPSPPYVAGVPGFSLRANVSSNLIRIGERAKFYFDILMRRMVSTLKVEVREETTLFVLNGVCKNKRKILWQQQSIFNKKTEFWGGGGEGRFFGLIGKYTN